MGTHHNLLHGGCHLPRVPGAGLPGPVVIAVVGTVVHVEDGVVMSFFIHRPRTWRGREGRYRLLLLTSLHMENLLYSRLSSSTFKEESVSSDTVTLVL